MARRIPVVELAIDVQVAIVELRRVVAPMYEAAIASGRWDAMAEAKSIADDLNRAQRGAKRLAGLAEGCEAEHTFGLFHGAGGRAA